MESTRLVMEVVAGVRIRLEELGKPPCCIEVGLDLLREAARKLTENITKMEAGEVAKIDFSLKSFTWPGLKADGARELRDELVKMIEAAVATDKYMEKVRANDEERRRASGYRPAGMTSKVIERDPVSREILSYTDQYTY